MSIKNNATEQPAPANPAATVILIRDGATTVEVFLLERAAEAAFGGQFVFPGGRVDDADHDPQLYERCRGLDDHTANAQLGVEQNGLSYWVASVREAFEESGIMLADNVTESLSAFREPLLAGDITLLDICQQEDLSLATDAIQYISFWITPEYRPKRFSTRFFVAGTPVGQTAQHDGSETVGSLWVPVREALTDAGRKKYRLHPPTIANLKKIEPYDCVDDVIAAMAALDKRTIEPVMPKRIRTPHGSKLTVPGDPDYPPD